MAYYIPDWIAHILAPEGEIDRYAARLGIVAATAFTASVTHAFSIMISVFELVGVPRLILPMCGASCTAVVVSSYIAPSIFDSIMRIKGLHGLPLLISIGKATLPAAVIMRRDLDHLVIKRRMSVAELKDRIQDLSRKENGESVVPIVEDWEDWTSGRGEKSMMFMGSVARASLEELTRVSSWKLDRGEIDVLQMAHGLNLMVNALIVGAHTALNDICLLAQQASVATDMMTCFVVENGALLGVITPNELEEHSS